MLAVSAGAAAVWLERNCRRW